MMMRVRRATQDASRSELSQQRAGHSRTDNPSWRRCLTHIASSQTRRYTMAWLTVWLSALVGFVAGAAWSGRMRG